MLDKKAPKGIDLDVSKMSRALAQDFYAFLRAEKRILAGIHSHRDDEALEKLRCTLDYVHMSKRWRVEGTRVEGEPVHAVL
jgi:hypothetical protein